MKLLITGSSGFLGKHVMQAIYKNAAKLSDSLLAQGEPIDKSFGSNSSSILTPSSNQLDLTSQSSVINYFDKNRPNIVLHMAAYCGGIGLNKKCPADLTHVNLKMAINLFDAIYKYPPDYVYTLGSVCSYPEHCPVPFKEDDIWCGYPESTNAGYGLAKKMLFMLQKEYRKQYGLKGAHLVPVNMYGPHDHTDLENSHVIPALINKFHSAVKEDKPTVECWGTGEATREFLYAGDAAQAIVKAITTGLDYPEPINLGTGRDISIKNLAHLIANLTNYKGKVVFTGEVSDGQPKRRLDVSRAEDLLSWKAETPFTDGLVKTIQWYVNRINHEK